MRSLPSCSCWDFFQDRVSLCSLCCLRIFCRPGWTISEFKASQVSKWSGAHQ
ncbi:rCG63117 [Rattus norvegicus]|uniref:RCG63117 n=1 Tax=Rattus norvegicus TaxID=10116 RepID=A6KHU7_RAT|nr:rCG63117 [Rattus norvegicus]